MDDDKPTIDDLLAKTKEYVVLFRDGDGEIAVASSLSKTETDDFLREFIKQATRRPRH